jgi:hypothetical protein
MLLDPRVDPRGSAPRELRVDLRENLASHRLRVRGEEEAPHLDHVEPRGSSKEDRLPVARREDQTLVPGGAAHPLDPARLGVVAVALAKERERARALREGDRGEGEEEGAAAGEEAGARPPSGRGRGERGDDPEGDGPRRGRADPGDSEEEAEEGRAHSGRFRVLLRPSREERQERRRKDLEEVRPAVGIAPQRHHEEVGEEEREDDPSQASIDPPSATEAEKGERREEEGGEDRLLGEVPADPIRGELVEEPLPHRESPGAEDRLQAKGAPPPPPGEAEEEEGGGGAGKGEGEDVGPSGAETATGGEAGRQGDEPGAEEHPRRVGGDREDPGEAEGEGAGRRGGETVPDGAEEGEARAREVERLVLGDRREEEGGRGEADRRREGEGSGWGGPHPPRGEEEEADRRPAGKDRSEAEGGLRVGRPEGAGEGVETLEEGERQEVDVAPLPRLDPLEKEGAVHVPAALEERGPEGRGRRGEEERERAVARRGRSRHEGRVGRAGGILAGARGGYERAESAATPSSSVA